MRVDVYESVTQTMLAELEKGVAPWRKPWIGGGPVNVRTGKPYRGINIFLLGISEYGDPRWGTFDAVKETAVKAAIAEGREIITETKVVKGRPRKTYYEVIDGEKVWFRGGVRKGEKGTYIVLSKKVRKRQKDENDEESGSYLLRRFYTVFNAEQAEGLPAIQTEYEHEPIERAQQLVDGFVGGPAVLFGGGRASYSLTKDLVRCPEMGQFVTAEAFYSTLYHELVHATGAESRLKRDMSMYFASVPYSKEELVAEMGAAMLCGIAGIDNLDDSASYVGGWLERLQDDRKLVVSAAGFAQRAADLILGVTFEEEEDKQVELAA